MIHPSRLTPRRQAAVLSFLRLSAVLFVVFFLLIVGYYLYVNVLNRAPAEVYVTGRSTAIAAVYGTVTINPQASLPLYAQNAGYLHTAEGLENINTANGTAVKKDQLLGTVVDEIGQRTLRSAQADFDTAQARLKTGPADAPSLRSAQDRLRALNQLASGNVPQVERDAARNTANQLAAAVANQELELRHMAEATASSLKAAQDQQGRTAIYAPFPGVLTFIGFGNNAYVLPNQMVYTVATTETNVVGQVNEEDVGQLKPGMRADVHLYYADNVTFPATLDQIFPAPDANSSRYTVLLHLDTPPADIRFGLTGEMNIIVGRKENALIMPTRALTNVDQVLIVEEGVVAQRTIKVGYKNPESAEVLEGLNEGDAVIVSDQEEFRPGQRVRPVKINNVKQRKR